MFQALQPNVLPNSCRKCDLWTPGKFGCSYMEMNCPKVITSVASLLYVLINTFDVFQALQPNVLPNSFSKCDLWTPDAHSWR